MIVLHCVLIKIQSEIFKNIHILSQKRLDNEKIAQNFFCSAEISHLRINSKNEASAETYFSDVALDQKSLATPAIQVSLVIRGGYVPNKSLNREYQNPYLSQK